MVMEKRLDGSKCARRRGVYASVCVGIRLSLSVYAFVGDEAEQDWIHKTNANKTETRMQSGSP